MTESLMTQIRDAALKAEDIIESHTVDQRLSKPGAQSCVISPPDLQEVIQELDSAMDKLQGILEHGSDGMRNSSFSDAVSSSPDPTSKNTVVGLDEDLIKLKDRLTSLENKLQKNSQLAVTLYQSLTGKRYLVVLDDMWSTKAWDDYHQMHLLDKFESWNLLQQKVFGEDNCPPEFEKIGRSIASDCGGLPLAIHVIDHEILASKLIRKWVAEGFLKSNGDKSLEERAEENLKVLVDRNLLMVRERKSNGKAKNYSIHDLLRDLCVKKAAQDKFLHVKNRQVHNVPEGSSYFPRRVSVHQSYRITDVYGSTEFMSLVRSFLCIGLASRVILSPVFSALRLLRVLDVLHIEFHQFPTEILGLVNLHYLAFSCNSDLPSAISRLWNLQTLIVRSSLLYMYLPSEIWEMPELRHIKFKKTRINIDDAYRKKNVQRKLQTISCTTLDQLIDCNLLGNIPNIKNLGIHSANTIHVDLSHLHRLEILKCSARKWSRTSISKLNFPPSIRKLTLSKLSLHWSYMTNVGALSNLEVLKIRKCTFKGQEMQPRDDEEWADETHFPRLRHLLIQGCSALEEIPSGIGEIPTLEIIELDECSPSVVASAKQIQEDQREYGNDGLEVHIR
ncbi:putative late blight resistance proteinR1B-12 [Sesamum angolense]|uniref:Late blight resistance proteinR1B-12 n=1 Tax=Sesamum angolense TaxID=2727404 RepID=A0AAE1X5J4_9LAMI|nr:putative late blight resistance proteinR1B-12 [Sesamum angolense]